MYRKSNIFGNNFPDDEVFFKDVTICFVYIAKMSHLKEKKILLHGVECRFIPSYTIESRDGIFNVYLSLKWIPYYLFKIMYPFNLYSRTKPTQKFYN